MKRLVPILALMGAAGLAGCDRGGEPGAADRPATAPVADVQTAAPGAGAELAPPPAVDLSPSVGAPGSDGVIPGSPPPVQGPSAVRAPGAPAEPQAPPPSVAGTGAAADDVLQRAERVYAGIRSMEADFIQEVYVPLLEATQHSSGRIYHRSPDRFAMRFTDPDGDLIVADGRYLWMYYPSTDPRQVIRAPMAAGAQQVDLHREFLSDASSRYAATRTGSESVGGRATHALTLVPRGPSPYRSVRIWVDERDALVRRFEITEENGTIRRLELSRLQPNAASPDAVFQFTPPPGAQVFDP